MRKVDEILLQGRDDDKQIVEVPFESKKLIESTTPYKGHIMFEINCTTMQIVPATYEEITTDLKGKVRRKLIVNYNCVYISCLNKRSAKKKFTAWLITKSIEKKNQQ